ncbi:unnamed protein product [Callosobruchus maculatus]|uniref:Uncharacterized protein n=1 Tax=Callosobruchus maculatus TaxID=64391 RepID=A0A653CJU9_CALMS|nr:unnamed protein product [Callosobruchus maculatus]
MKLLSALFVIGVLSKADSRALENGDSRIINGKEVDVNDYPFMVKLTSIYQVPGIKSKYDGFKLRRCIDSSSSGPNSRTLYYSK